MRATLPSLRTQVCALALLVAIASPITARSTPEDAERFTHLAGFNLADLPSFDDLANKLGKSPIAQSGDAGNYDARVCYRNTDNGTVIVFFHGEVNWGFTVRRPRSRDAKCPLSAALDAAHLDDIAGITLGMDKSAYESLVGQTDSVTGNQLTRDFRYTHTLTDQELKALLERGRDNGYPAGNPEDFRSWDVGITLSASFAHGRLITITVDRVETT